MPKLMVSLKRVQSPDSLLQVIVLLLSGVLSTYPKRTRI